MFWILYDATPGKAAELEDMCFLEGHRAISQKDDDKNNFGAAWWRLDGSTWEPLPGSRKVLKEKSN